MAKIAERGEGGQGRRHQYGAKTPGPEPLFQQIADLDGEACSQMSPSSLLTIQRANGVLPCATCRPNISHRAQNPPAAADRSRSPPAGVRPPCGGSRHPSTPRQWRPAFCPAPAAPSCSPLEVLRQHRQRVWQDAIGEAIVFFLIEQPVVGGEPLLQRLQIRLQGGQRILQLELGSSRLSLLRVLASLPAPCASFSSQRREPLTLAEAAP